MAPLLARVTCRCWHWALPAIEIGVGGVFVETWEGARKVIVLHVYCVERKLGQFIRHYATQLVTKQVDLVQSSTITDV